MDVPNAFRVLQIMDKAGCDIEEVNDTTNGKYWVIKPKYYVSKDDAEDLIKIILFKNQYKKRSRLWWKLIFRNLRYGCRPCECWYNEK